MHRLVKTTLVAGLTGALSLSAAWAGVGLAPVSLPSVAPVLPAAGTAAGSAVAGAAAQAGLPTLPGAAGAQGVAQVALSGGEVLAGAAKTDLYPRPDLMKTKGFPEARWEKDRKKCLGLDPAFLERLATNTQQEIDHLVTAGSPWNENPNCLYMGGYGIGPMNPITAWDTKNGLWIRTLALSDGNDVLTLSVIDAEGYLWDYANKCADCGIKQLGERLAADADLKAAGFKPESFNLHATHSHTSMDFLGGWGFVPDWYMAQVEEAILANVKQAVLDMDKAKLEAGEADARRHNGERRDTYRSAEEAELTWLRAVGTNGTTIATMGAFAAHPVTESSGSGIAHADWPGWFARAAEDRFGGVGMHFMTGLGNVTGAKNHREAANGTVERRSTGEELVDLIPEIGAGRQVKDTDIRIASTTVRSALTNVALDALGTPGFFDRRFDATPVAVRVGKSAEAPCASASPQSVELPVRAMKIGGDIVITTGPGELFSNLTNVIKERSADQVVFPLAQTNDSLGYMPQSFEHSTVGGQALGFGLGGYGLSGAMLINYEDSYAIDHCVGDLVLESTLGLVNGLK